MNVAWYGWRRQRGLDWGWGALIQRFAGVAASEMYEVFNMGIGFCYVVDPAAADLVLAILKKHGRTAQRIGHAVVDPEKKVRIPERNLVGQHKSFRSA